MRYNSGTPTSARSTTPTQLVPRFSQRFSASYVTGSHNVQGRFPARGKLPGDRGAKTATRTSNTRSTIRCRSASTQWATPVRAQGAEPGLRLLRSGSMDAPAPDADLRRFATSTSTATCRPQHVPATPNGWVPERNFDEVKNVPLWKDFDPRVGAAYDLFGNGRTALKVALGRYVAKSGNRTITQNQQSDSDLDQLGQPHVERPLLPGRRPASRQLSSRTATSRTAA